MTVDTLATPLLRVPLFQGLKPLQLTEIARRAERIVFRTGGAIIESGRDGDAAFLIVSGEALRTAGPAALHSAPERVPVGALVGEMAMLVETVHTSTIIAHGPVRALKITRQGLHEQMAHDPALADHFVAKIASRLTQLVADLRCMEMTLAAPTGTAGYTGRGNHIATPAVSMRH